MTLFEDLLRYLGSGKSILRRFDVQGQVPNGSCLFLEYVNYSFAEGYMYLPGDSGLFGSWCALVTKRLRIALEQNPLRIVFKVIADLVCNVCVDGNSYSGWWDLNYKLWRKGIFGD